MNFLSALARQLLVRRALALGDLRMKSPKRATAPSLQLLERAMLKVVELLGDEALKNSLSGLLVSRSEKTRDDSCAPTAGAWRRASPCIRCDCSTPWKTREMSRRLKV